MQRLKDRVLDLVPKVRIRETRNDAVDSFARPLALITTSFSFGTWIDTIGKGHIEGDGTGFLKRSLKELWPRRPSLNDGAPVAWRQGCDLIQEPNESWIVARGKRFRNSKNTAAFVGLAGELLALFESLSNALVGASKRCFEHVDHVWRRRDRFGKRRLKLSPVVLDVCTQALGHLFERGVVSMV